MHFIIRVGDLLSAIRIALRGVSKGSQSSLLEGILFETRGKDLILCSTDLRISVKTSVECDVREEGKYVFNSNIIYDIVSKLKSNDMIEVKVDENMGVKATSGRSRLNFQALNSGDFPEFPSINDDTRFTIKGEALKDLINKNRISVSIDENRMIYTGIKFKVNEEKLTGVSLDGYRVTIVDKPIHSNANDEFIVPSVSLYEVEKLVKDDDEVTIMRAKNHAMVLFGSTAVYTRLFDGDFFDYSGLLAESGPTEVVLDKDVFKECLDRSMIVAKGNLNMVRLDIKEGNMHLGSTGNLGETSDDMEIQKAGEDLVIGFNPRYLKEGVSLFADKTVRLVFRDSASPLNVYGTSEDGLKYILLPVRLQN